MSEITQDNFSDNLTLLDAGGGSRSPPYHQNVALRKMLKESVADFFFTFPKYVNGVLETTFCSKKNIWSGQEGTKVVKIDHVS